MEKNEISFLFERSLGICIFIKIKILLSLKRRGKNEAT